jgi:hypothetical protein
MNEKIKFFIFGFVSCLLLVAAGAGFYFYRSGPCAIGILDKRYDSQYAGAAETIGRLERELEQERGINRQLREHNNRARELTGELARAAGRNVRNLQDAVVIIGEIRAKLKILADFYADSGTGGCGAGGVDGE